MKSFLTILFCCFSYLTVFGQAQLPQNSIEYKITDYYKKLPQEKIYIHTDRTCYAAGDTIWFRAYLLDALSHIPMAESRYIYVELRQLDRTNPVQRIMVRCDSAGIFSNALPISPKLTEGEYTLSAYTLWMSNFGSQHFCAKKIQVINSFSQATTDSVSVRHLKAFDLSVMPEGGNLLVGKLQKVAFKALGDDGYGADVDIRVVQKDGEILLTAQSQHLGMGYFSVTPAAGEQLYVEAYTQGGLSKRVPLPMPLSSGVTLSVQQVRDNLLIQPFATDEVDIRKLVIVVYGGNNLLVSQELKPDNTLMRIPLSSLTEGVVNVALVDNVRNEVLAERPVYVRAKSSAHADIKTEGNAGKARSVIKLALQIKDGEGKGMKGNYSLAVTDAKSIVPDTVTANAVSYLLLTSDIKGYVEQPNYYFKTINAATNNALDLLLLTQAWRRYDLSKMLQNDYPHITHSFQKYQTISGEARNIALFGKTENPRISLMTQGQSIMNSYPLGDSSRFCISKLAFEDGTTFVLSTTNKKGKSKFMNLKIDSLTFPRFSPLIFSLKGKQETQVNELFYTHSRERIRNSKALREINLQEVKVTAKKVTPILNRAKVEPDRAIKEGDLALKFTSTMESLINQLGVRINSTDGVKYLAPLKARVGSPLVYIDNFPATFDDLWNLAASDVKQLELIKPGNAGALLYSNGVMLNGAVLIFLKDGGEKKNVVTSDAIKTVNQLGYKPTITFYSPQYATPAERKEVAIDLRTTLMWEPCVRTDENGNATVEFYTTDNPGDFHIVLEGVSDNGSVVTQRVLYKP